MTSKTEQKPFSERIDNIIEKLLKPSNLFTRMVDPHGVQVDCVICGEVRLDPDSTGVTCGGSQCLLEIGREFRDLPEDVYREMENARQKLISIINNLGVNSEIPLEDLLLIDLCKLIDDEVSRLQLSLEELTKITEENKKSRQ